MNSHGHFWAIGGGMKTAGRYKTTKAVIILVLIASLVACATSSDLQKGSGSTFEVLDRSYDDVWQAAVTVCTRIIIIEVSDKDTGTIKGHTSGGAFSSGEVVGVFITRHGGNKYSVDVVSKKRVTTQIAGQNWEQTIIAGIKAELNI
jgi:hypothetical protein